MSSQDVRLSGANAPASNAADGNENCPIVALYMEPDPKSFTTIVTGKHVWAARRSGPMGPGAPTGPTAAPMVPFEDLPFPRSNRAKIAACTVRWQFTGRFSINKEENSARGSLTVQVKRFLEAKGFPNPAFTVNFPRGVGRGRFVDICVDRSHMAVIVDAPLIYRSSKLQRHLVGPILPCTAMVAEVTNFSENEDVYRLAQTVAIYLRPYCQVHDIWAEMHSLPGDAVLRPGNKLVVLAETAATRTGGRDIARVQAIPGYINLGGTHCEIQYVGRLAWCNMCKSNTTLFHTFDNCPRRSCYRCGRSGHSAALCDQEAQHPDDPDAPMAGSHRDAAAEEAVDLNYGQA